MAEESTTGTSTSAASAAAPATGAATGMPEGMGDAGKKALQEERAGRAEAERTAAETRRQLEQLQAELQGFRDRDKTEAEKLTDRATAAERTAADAAAALLKYQIAAEKNLPASLAGRLQGGTREELAADADGLLKLLATQQTAPSFDGGVRQTPPAPTDMNSMIRRQAGMG
jgi:hypothetical protein